MLLAPVFRLPGQVEHDAAVEGQEQPQGLGPDLDVGLTWTFRVDRQQCSRGGEHNSRLQASRRMSVEVRAGAVTA
eukprot:1934961-Rhodomonas_salina.2